jgi:hypothetical protein
MVTGLARPTSASSPAICRHLGVVPEFTSRVAGLTVTATGLQAEDPSLPATPQQFRWECAAHFDTTLSAFTGVTALRPVPVALTATISGLRASVALDLVLDEQLGPPRTG